MGCFNANLSSIRSLSSHNVTIAPSLDLQVFGTTACAATPYLDPLLTRPYIFARDENELDPGYVEYLREAKER